MKKQTILTLLILLTVSNLWSQCTQIYKFKSPTTSGSTTTFNNIQSGKKSTITQTATKNATVSNIDDTTTSGYYDAWQPFIRFTTTNTNSTDSSWVEFLIEFKDTGNNPDTQQCVSMTIVDLDGTNSYRELIKSTFPVSAVGFPMSAVQWSTNTRWYSFISGTTTYNNIDTSNYVAMAQLNYTNVVSYKLRIGVIGTVQANQVRQYSLYFKSFDTLNVPLPVKWIHIKGEKVDGQYAINWVVDETNTKNFEVEQFYNGEWINIGTVPSNHHGINNYYFSSFGIPDKESYSLFRVKQIDYDFEYGYSKTILISNNQLLDEEATIIYNSYWIMIYEGLLSDFYQLATPNKLYFTSQGYKFIRH